jgi:hypothetical protein
MVDLNINPIILTFDDITEKLPGNTFVEKLDNYKKPRGYTYMSGVVESFLEYLTEDAQMYQMVYILFITDGDVHDLQTIKNSLLTCLDVIISKKISVYVSCVAINASADMKAFSLLGILNNFSIFQLVQSNNGCNWSQSIIQKFKEIQACSTTTYNSKSEFLYSDIMVDLNVSEQGKHNKVYLASLVQAFTICNFSKHKEDGFMKCKHLLKYITDMGINAKTRYIWNKLNTAKMVGNKDSNVIADEFLSTINDCNKNEVELDHKNESVNDESHFISITNEHDVRVRFFVGKEKSFTECLPISITPQNQICIESSGASELYLNIEVYHPYEPVDLEISFGDDKHKWFVPYGVSLIEGDVKYLMLAHEKYKESSGCTNEEKLFDFIVKTVPSSMMVEEKDKEEDCNESRDEVDLRSYYDYNKTSPVPFKVFPTTSKEIRKIDIIKRKNTFNLSTQILCFSFIFTSNVENIEKPRLSDIMHVTKECVICLDKNSTIKLICNHKCFCDACYDHYINSNNDRKCPLCRQHF